MTGSFKRIDYSIRPAKHAERRMLCDVFRRLRPFGPVEDYVYVGFGSVWFADFVLFHRALGIRDMISIEQAASARDRIEDNKPFRIPVDYRSSREALPDLDWQRRQVLWLDYDDPISPDILLDMHTVVGRASSGTVIAVSVQCSRAPQVAEAEQDTASGAATAIERFTNVFGRQRVSQDTGTEELFGWPFGNLSRRLLVQEIEAALAVRNANNAENPFVFQKICEIEYEDGAKMTTVVGIFFDASDRDRTEQCNFSSLDFLRPGSGLVRITVPKLTIKEFKRLESQLPLAPGTELMLGTIPLSEARRFADMYRYLPSFAVLES